MTGTKRTYCKALALLIVFSLNTVVSFACSFSSLFHSFHHSASSGVSGHSHSGGHQHSKGGDHHHQSSTSHQHHEPATSDRSGDDDCCSRFVVEIEKAEKAVSRTIEAPDALFLTVFLSSHTLYFSGLPQEEKSQYPVTVRRRFPATIQDLRIVIQSFQI